MPPPDDAPSRRYYRAMHGRWTSDFVLELTDPEAFAAAPLSFVDRLRFRATFVMCRLLGPFTIETEVDDSAASTSGRVKHRLRISKWRMTMIVSVEEMILHEDGRSVAMDGVQRMLPAPWTARRFAGARATIADDAEHAEYDLPLFGIEVHQSTSVIPTGLRLVQTTTFFRAVVDLRRVVAE